MPIEDSDVEDLASIKPVLQKLIGRNVSRCCVDYALGLQFFDVVPDTVAQETETRIETPFRLKQPGGETVLDPNKLEEAGQGAVLAGKKVSEAEVLEDGTLVLVFVSGVEVRVPPDPNYDAWSISGPRGFLVVCAPGGGLSYWSEKDPGDRITPPRDGRHLTGQD